jgi:glycosyltransferase involved in cell wall biosynthesis
MRPAELGAKDTDRMRECYRILLQRPEISVVGCAQACIDDHIDWLGLTDKKNFHAVHNGVDAEAIIAASAPALRTAQRAALGLAPEDIVIGTAFRFAELKRPFLWIDAAAQVLTARSDCKFVMFGDGELRDRVQCYIRDRQLAGKFVLPGRVRDLHRRLCALDLFVLSSRTEALPNALLEAQAAGVPVIAFNVGGVGEAMIDGMTGRLVGEQTAEALGSCVLAAISDLHWRRQAATSAQKFVRENFSMEGMFDSLSSILLQSV